MKFKGVVSPEQAQLHTQRVPWKGKRDAVPPERQEGTLIASEQNYRDMENLRRPSPADPAWAMAIDPPGELGACLIRDENTSTNVDTISYQSTPVY